MTEITTQSLVEQINSSTVLSMQLKSKITDKKKELEENELVIQIEEMEEQLKKVQKNETELKERVKETMMNAGMKKFEALDGTIVQLNKKPWALVIEDESILPLDEYRKEKVTVSIDKKQLKEDIKEWLIIEWVSIKEDYTLIIK